MKGLIASVMITILCLGSSIAMAKTYRTMWLQTNNGDKVKVIVASKEAYKLKGTTGKIFLLETSYHKPTAPLAKHSNPGNYNGYY